MLTDFHRGFATYLASFTRSNFHQHRSEPTRKTREFDEKLRLYLELKPVDLIRGKIEKIIVKMYVNFKSVSQNSGRQKLTRRVKRSGPSTRKNRCQSQNRSSSSDSGTFSRLTLTIFTLLTIWISWTRTTAAASPLWIMLTIGQCI